ncbi:hypothetical protein AS850_00825 [Frondihabitans sp. 762G35]|uniref:hypothetical protein n=1 Tax=Frondihabitans sp. 762G35 TaxID=1446794 RepID=UPI000D2000E5|nr:hypothetical protein [Frondihabitans sp. 762G35]ARC55616.1 hypothetical protein AS850_00825 [Frondihabitans sp. 762G35]
MTYSQPDPAEETTADIEPQQPDTDPNENASKGDAETQTDVQSEDVPTGRDTTDDTEGGGTA